MPLLYIIAAAITIAFVAGMMTRYNKTLRHFLNTAGMLKVVIFIALSAILLLLSIHQRNGFNTIVIPTVLGLALNGVIFTIFIEYMKQRENEKIELSKISAMNDLIGNTLYYFQSYSQTDFYEYRDGTQLINITKDSILNLISHYQHGHQISKVESLSFPRLGEILNTHIPIYTSILSSAYTLDPKLARIWTEIIITMNFTSSTLISSSSLLSECNSSPEGRGVLYIASHSIVELLKKILILKEYEKDRMLQLKN